MTGINWQTLEAIVGVATAAIVALRVLVRQHQLAGELDECRRDRATLRKQVELVQRSLLSLLPPAQRNRLADQLQAIELNEEAA